MTLAQLLPQAQFIIVTTPQPTAQKVARRSAQMAHKVDLEIGGVIENMSSFTTPAGERFTIFGEGGGQELADELDVPLLGKVPLTMPLREHADSGVPLVIEDPDDPAAQAIRQAARGLIAMAPLELPVLNGNGATDGGEAATAPRRRAPSRSVCRCRWPEAGDSNLPSWGTEAPRPRAGAPQPPARMIPPPPRVHAGGPRRQRLLAKYSALIWVYFCHSSGSWSSAKQASTGQASTQASQSMHSSGSMYSISAASYPGSSGVGWMQSTGHTSTQELSLVPMHGSAIT